MSIDNNMESNVKTFGLYITLFMMFFFLSFPKAGDAFHDGGIAACEGCHTMHNSQNDAAVTNAYPQYQAGPYLLRGTDQSSVCLNCHEHAGDTGPSSFHISTSDIDMPTGSPPFQLTPGGDFGWLKKTYNWTGVSGPQTSRGERHGHNIIAVDYGYTADSTHSTAPGGNPSPYPANALSCTSCHDPHGQFRQTSAGAIVKPEPGTAELPIKNSGSYDTSPDPDASAAVGVYRLLGGIGYQPKSLSGSYAFTFKPFSAAAPDTYNREENTADVRVAYGNNVSQWCANCHGILHTPFVNTIQTTDSHPADEPLGSDMITIYNTYIKTGDLTGINATAYLSLVPFQNNTDDMTILKGAVSSTAGPVTGDRIMCLTCHRVHASGWDSITRFPTGSTFMTVDDGLGNPVYPSPAANPDDAMGRTTIEYQKALYDRAPTKFAPYQRVLCDKCHNGTY